MACKSVPGFMAYKSVPPPDLVIECIHPRTPDNDAFLLNILLHFIVLKNPIIKKQNTQ